MTTPPSPASKLAGTEIKKKEKKNTIRKKWYEN
jgi:hypothetical protein